MKKDFGCGSCAGAVHGAVRRGFCGGQVQGRHSRACRYARWVAGVAYNAEQECLALADEVDYKLYTSNNAEEMTTQLDDSHDLGRSGDRCVPAVGRHGSANSERD